MTTQKVAGMAREQVKRLGTLLGFHATMWLDRIEKKQTHLVEGNTVVDIVKQVLVGSVDATNLEPNVVNHALKILGKPGAVVINKNIPFETYSFHLSTLTHKHVIEEFNEYLKNNPKFVEALKSKYSILDATPFRTGPSL